MLDKTKLDNIVIVSATTAILTKLASNGLIIRADNAELEAKHPRDNEGKFAEQGMSFVPQIGTTIQAAMKSLGFSKKKKTNKYEAGEHEFEVIQADPTQKYMSGWIHTATGTKGKNAKELKKFAEQLQLAQALAPVTPVATEPVTKQTEIPSIEQLANKPPYNWAHKDTAFGALVSGGVLDYYSMSEGGNVSVFKIPDTNLKAYVKNSPTEMNNVTYFAWAIFNPSGQIANGYGANNLKKEVQKQKQNELTNEKYPPEAFNTPIDLVKEQQITNTNQPLKLSSMKKVGNQLGSNSGGTYEDTEGNKYYVKIPEKKEVAQNELAAAALYKLAGVNTFDYQPVETETGGMGVATKWQNMAATNVNQLTSAQRKEAQKDFAVHAWLANWDAAGLTGDNVGVTADGKVTTLDVGGSLEYRAKGSPKGHLFNNDANEWETLRDPAKNSSSAQLFGDMTKEELLQSFNNINRISEKDILDALKSNGYSDVAANALAQKLIARKTAIAQKLVNAFKPNPPSEPEHVGQQLKIPEDYHSIGAKLFASNKEPNSAQMEAIKNYTSSGYHSTNKMLRMGLVPPKGKIKELTSYLNTSSLPEETIVSRKLSDDYASYLMENAELNMEITDLGFGSTSINKNSWSGTLQTHVKLPKGSKAAFVDPWSLNKGEQEVIVQRGARYKIIGISKDGKVIDLELLSTYEE